MTNNFIGDAVKSPKQVNHIQSFLDKLYSVYNLPKAQRELACCASELGIKVKKIGRVLGVRWAASSFQTVEAIWSNCSGLYPALVSHCKESSDQGSSSSTHQGMLSTIQSTEIIHSLAALHDVLKEICIVSEAVQVQDCNLTLAYKLISRLTRALKSQTEGRGDCFEEYQSSVDLKEFKGVKLTSQSRIRKMNREAFFQALIDNVASRLEGTVASGARRERDNGELRNLLLDIDAVDPTKWPSGVGSHWSQGEQRVRTLCD